METSVHSEQSPPAIVPERRRRSSLWLVVLLLPLLTMLALWWFLYRPAANASRSAYNLKWIMIGMHNHHDTFTTLPNGYLVSSQSGRLGKPSAERFSWRVQILPYIEHGELFDQFHLDEPWDSEHNLKVASQMPDVFRSRWDPPGTTDAGYLHVEDPDAAFPTAGPARSDSERYSKNSIRNITDGTSDTIGVIEVANSGIHWAQPTDISLADAISLLQTGKVSQPGTAEVRSKAALVGMMDASVRNVPIGISAADAKALITRHGGERIDHAALGWEKPRSR